MKINIDRLSEKYHMKRLGAEDIDTIYEICIRNELFYQYHPPVATHESILEDIQALPPGKEQKDKLYVGFFNEHILIAVMDLIIGYPNEKTAYIGFFMVNREYQKSGVGSKIISECIAYLKELGVEKIRLAIDQGNSQSEAFWTKNEFIKTGEILKNDFSAYLPMEREII